MDRSAKLKKIIILTVVIIVMVGALIYSVLTYGFRNYGFTVSPNTPSTSTISQLPQLSACVILDQQYCGTGKLVSQSGSYYAGFSLPPGTKIYAPFDGVFITSGSLGQITVNGVKYQMGTLNPASIMPPNMYAPTSSTQQFVALANFVSEANRTVKKGDLLGTVGSQTYQGYDLVISLNSYNSQKKYFIPNLSVFKQYFSNL
ncbi:MAG: M23 family metallopeptidase [Patescibacteria group bacterium]|nr:M23 family metallopeptidase [Patescibacteria group bacterium]